jgi:hypothetical protein
MKAYPLWRWCGGGKQAGDLRDPRNLRFLYVGESDTVAQKNIRDLTWHFENNQLLRALFPQIVPPDFNKVVWRDDEIEINRPQSFDEPSIKSVGVGAKSTGFHFDCLIYDDIIGIKAANSEAEMKSAIDWFSYASGLANDPATVEEILIGTRWKHGSADLYGYIMEELSHNEEQGERASGFAWDVEGCYDEEGEPRFYQRFTHSILQDIRKREREYKFSCQYLNDPSAPEGSKFTHEMIKTFHITVGVDGKKDLLVPNDGTPPIKLSQLARISFNDPSSGGNSAKCEHAICCLGTSADGRKFAFKIWSEPVGFRKAAEEWFKLNDQFFTWPNYFEAVGAHKELATVIELRQQEGECSVCKQAGKSGVRHKRLAPVPISPPGGRVNKEDRILTYAQSDFEEGRVYIHENDIKTRNQILRFPYGDMIDRFDALAYTLNLARRPHTIDEQEALERDRTKRELAKSQYTAQTYDVGGYI